MAAPKKPTPDPSAPAEPPAPAQDTGKKKKPGIGDLIAAENPDVPAASSPAEALKQVLTSKLLTDLQKKHGEKVFAAGAEYRDPTSKIPTGVFPLDHALGGGVAVGRVLEVYGKKSCGKTTVLSKIVAGGQKLCSRCYTRVSNAGKCKCGDYRPFVAGVADVEGTFHMGWAAKHGVDTAGLLYAKPACGEEAVDVLDAWIRTGEVDLVALDSIAFLASIAEQTDEAGKAHPGGTSILVGQMVRKLLSGAIAVQRARGREVTVVLLNQLREKVGVMYGPTELTPGGNAPGFYATVEVRLSPPKYETDPATGRALWGDFPFKIEKNKLVNTVTMAGNYRMMLADTEFKKAGEVADENYVVLRAQEVGLIEGAGSHWTAYKEDYNSRSAIEKRMLTDPAFAQKLRADTMKVLVEAMR